MKICLLIITILICGCQDRTELPESEKNIELEYEKDLKVWNEYQKHKSNEKLNQNSELNFINRIMIESHVSNFAFLGTVIGEKFTIDLVNEMQSMQGQHNKAMILLAIMGKGDLIKDKVESSLDRNQYNWIDQIMALQAAKFLINNADIKEIVAQVSKNHWLKPIRELAKYILLDSDNVNMTSYEKYIFYEKSEEYFWHKFDECNFDNRFIEVNTLKNNELNGEIFNEILGINNIDSKYLRKVKIDIGDFKLLAQYSNQLIGIDINDKFFRVKPNGFVPVKYINFLGQILIVMRGHDSVGFDQLFSLNSTNFNLEPKFTFPYFVEEIQAENNEIIFTGKNWIIKYNDEGFYFDSSKICQ